MTRSSLLHRLSCRARRCMSLGMALFLCASPPARSGDDPPVWRGQVSLSSIYDNNALRYSDKYLGRFENREDEGRFHIQTTDDLLFQTSLHLERSLKPFSDLGSVFSGDLRLWKYTHNTIKDWWTFTLAARQELPARLLATFGYSHIPDFYVRHYSDDDWTSRVGQIPARFQPFSFTKDEYRYVLQQQFFQSSRVRLMYIAQRYYYNEHYTEYDSRNAVWSIDAAHPVLPTLRVSAGYAYTTSDTKGVDGPGEVRATSDDADGSFREDAYGAGMMWRLPRIAGLVTRLTLDTEYSRRCYTTTHYYYLDPQHSGRVDHEYMVSLAWSVRLDDPWEATIAYTWRERKARTSVPEIQNLLSDEKDYRQYQVELGLTYDFSF